MNVQIKLSDDQAETAKAYALIKAEIKCLEDQAKKFKVELDKIVDECTADYDDVVELVVEDEIVVTYSKAVYNFKFDCDIQSFITETGAYELLDVSVTKARKFLGEDRMRDYFKKVVGSRKSYIGKLISE
jgi:hypothetical protein